MLLEFSLSNWGSFASERTFSMVASRLKDDLLGRVATLTDPQHTQVLITALLLGKNGGGKSTLVSAIDFVRDFVSGSANANQQGQDIIYNPCRLEKSLVDSPTTFRVVFSMNDTIYQFEFSITKERVVSESLSIADRTVRFRKLYDRQYNGNDGYIYSFGEGLKGSKSVWQAATRDNALFLSTAVQLNSDALEPPFSWLAYYLRPVLSTGGFEGLTASRCLESEDFKRQVLTFLRELDINVDDFLIEEREFDDQPFRDTFTDKFIEHLKEARSNTKEYSVSFVRRDSDGDPVSFDLTEESTGTQALFRLAGPMFDTLNHGFCLIVDEINTNIHPLVLSAIISAFSNPNLNRNRAQLVFTSHDTSMLRDHKFRRDEIWLIGADELGRSDLVPLSDYSPRKGEALDKGYLSGRYGGVPFISSSLLKNLLQ